MHYIHDIYYIPYRAVHVWLMTSRHTVPDLEITTSIQQQVTNVDERKIIYWVLLLNIQENTKCMQIVYKVVF